jgi:hypothetical protein
MVNTLIITRPPSEKKRTHDENEKFSFKFLKVREKRKKAEQPKGTTGL